MYAELRREEGADGYYNLRYIVYNDNIVGSYGVFYSPRGTYGATRDYHRLATPFDWTSEYVVKPAPCEFHDDDAAVCDGSSMVEVITDDDKRAFEIAAMMAEVGR